MTPAELRQAAAFLEADAWSLRNARAPVAAFERSDLARKLREEAEGRGWQPIETAPRDGTIVMFGFPGSNRIVVEKWSPYCAQYTHWQPLPPGPEA